MAASTLRSHLREDNRRCVFDERLDPVDHEVCTDEQLRDGKTKEHLALDVRAAWVDLAGSVVVPRSQLND